VRRYLNLFATMLLGGLWHGASWTFVFWGGLHGGYLAVNHAFQAAIAQVRKPQAGALVLRACAWLITFGAVVVAWVFFRSTSFEAAVRVLRAMVSPWAGSFGSTPQPLLWNAGLDPTTALVACMVLAAVCLFAPNSNAIGERIRALCKGVMAWRALVCGYALTFVVFLIVLNESRDSVSAFIYFNF
jgi:alginate O-acetyltransferase complex protein AlgI